jgi:predicted DNA-binding protein
LTEVEKTIDILNKKTSQLKAEPTTEGSEKEIKEIEDLLPEVNAKVEELKELLLKQAKEDEAEIAAEMAAENQAESSSAVNDVSSLVKKTEKRKMETNAEPEMKKSKVEEEENKESTA